MAVSKEHHSGPNRPRRPDEARWFIEGKMRSAVASQQQEDAMLHFSPISSPWNLIRSFAQTPLFGTFRGEAISRFLIPKEGSEYDKATKESTQRLLPAFFQYLAEYVVRQQILENRQDGESRGCLLSYAKTLDVYQALYPGSRRIPAPYGLDGLEGISPPDAIEIVGDAHPVVTKLYEITSSESLDHFLKAVDGFDKDIRNHRRFFREDARFIYIVPKGAKNILMMQLRATNIPLPDDVVIEEFPFTHGEIFSQCRQVLFEGKSDRTIPALDGTIATLTDATNEAFRQSARLAADPALRSRLAAAESFVFAQRDPTEETSLYEDGRPVTSYRVTLIDQAQQDTKYEESA